MGKELYRGSATSTEYFDRIEFDGLPYLILTSVLDDPQYLNGDVHY